MQDGLGRLAHEVEVEQQDVFLGLLAVDRVYRHEVRRQVGNRPFGQHRLSLASSLGAFGRTGRRHRHQGFQPGDAPDLRVGVEESVKQRRASALKPGDRDDRAQIDVVDLRMASEEILNAQPLDQRPGESGFLDYPASGSQPGFVVYRPHELLQCLEVPVVAEVGEPGLSHRVLGELVDVQTV